LHHRWAIQSDGFGVFRHEGCYGGHLPLSPGDQASLTGVDHDKVGAHLSDTFEDIAFRTSTGRDGQHNCGHADDHPQDAQQRP